MTTLGLEQIKLDPELQPRAAIDRGVLEDYAQLLVDGVRLPPVTVFRVGADLLLADGFHRYHAHAALEADGIAAEVIDGSREDALRFSLSANAKHGKQRTGRDLARAYEIAVRNRLVDPFDSDAVVRLIGCSGRYADQLTADAREAARQEREARIVALKDAGKSEREIERETGVPRRTVRDIAECGRKENSAETAHLGPPPEKPAWVRELDEMGSPQAQAWHGALGALRTINAQPPAAALLADRYTRVDHAIARKIDRAANG